MHIMMHDLYDDVLDLRDVRSSNRATSVFEAEIGTATTNHFEINSFK